MACEGEQVGGDAGTGGGMSGVVVVCCNKKLHNPIEIKKDVHRCAT